MASGSIKSGIQLETYKIDHIEFNVEESLSILASNSHSDCSVRFRYSFRDVYKYTQTDKTFYVNGLRIDLEIYPKDQTDKALATGIFVITGLFSTTGEFEKDIEEKLLKFQAPAILFPYVRAAISFTITSAGFSTIIMPLVNVNAAAHSIDLKIIEK